MTEAVLALVEAIAAEPGTMADTLAQVALAQAALVDSGQPAAGTAINKTLEALAQAANLRGDGEVFDVFDIWCGLTPTGVRRNSLVGKALTKWMSARGMSLRKLGPFDRPWACPRCGFQADRLQNRRSREEDVS